MLYSILYKQYIIVHNQLQKQVNGCMAYSSLSLEGKR